MPLHAHLSSELPHVEQIVLWSMRAWVVGLHAPEKGVPERIRAAFADLGAPGCAVFLDGFMAALRRGAERTIGLDCPCKQPVEPDEAVLLRALALVQHRDRATAAVLLLGMISQDACVDALDSAERLGAELLRAGRLLRPHLRQERAPQLRSLH